MAVLFPWRNQSIHPSIHAVLGSHPCDKICRTTKFILIRLWWVLMRKAALREDLPHHAFRPEQISRSVNKPSWCLMWKWDEQAELILFRSWLACHLHVFFSSLVLFWLTIIESKKAKFVERGREGNFSWFSLDDRMLRPGKESNKPFLNSCLHPARSNSISPRNTMVDSKHTKLYDSSK